jgi:regulator of replication initiation timing
MRFVTMENLEELVEILGAETHALVEKEIGAVRELLKQLRDENTVIRQQLDKLSKDLEFKPLPNNKNWKQARRNRAEAAQQ